MGAREDPPGRGCQRTAVRRNGRAEAKQEGAVGIARAGNACIGAWPAENACIAAWKPSNSLRSGLMVTLLKSTKLYTTRTTRAAAANVE